MMMKAMAATARVEEYNKKNTDCRDKRPSRQSLFLSQHRFHFSLNQRGSEF
jgi:hypothetical protein